MSDNKRKRKLVDLGEDDSISASAPKKQATESSKKEKGSDDSSSSSSSSSSSKEEKKVETNPYNGKAYSSTYYKILEGRKGLPVFQQKDEFLEKLRKNQSVVLVGETGSGKTTQVKPHVLFYLFFLLPSCTQPQLHSFILFESLCPYPHRSLSRGSSSSY